MNQNMTPALEAIPQEQLADLLRQRENEIHSLGEQAALLRRERDELRFRCDEEQLLRDADSREREQQHLYNRMMLDALPSMLMVLDSEGRYLTGTDKLIARHFDLKHPLNLVGQPLAALFGGAVSEKWVEKTAANCREAHSTNSVLHYNDAIDYTDNRVMYVSVTISPVEDVCSGVLGVVFLMHDITELVMLKEAAEAASLAKSNFLANISHEIRTPMNALLGMANLLGATTLNDTQRGYVANMLGATDTLLGMIGDILDFSRIDAHRLELEVEEYLLVDLVRDVINVIGLRAAQKGLELLVDVDPTVPARLTGDALHIKQILINILSNAVKYTDSGKILFRVTASAAQEGTVALSFLVQDSGIGIREEDLSTLFTAFYQLDMHKHRTIQGTGLGLAISKGLAEAMSGSISVQSEYGKGSSFVLTIPQPVVGAALFAVIRNPARKHVLIIGHRSASYVLHKTLDAMFVRCEHLTDMEGFEAMIEKHAFTHVVCGSFHVEQTIKRFADRLSGVQKIVVQMIDDPLHQYDIDGVSVLVEPILAPDIARLLNMSSGGVEEEASDTLGAMRTVDVTALVVDDNEINQMVAAEILKFYDVQSVLASSGAQALELVRERDFDLIFMDHMMPEMDGIEATRRIRELGGWNGEVPIIALTANAVSGNRDFFLSSKMNDFLSKPLEISHLNDVLVRWLPPEKLRATSAARHAPEPAKSVLRSEQLARVEAECPVDVQATLALIGGSEDTYLSILGSFVDSMRHRVSLIRRLAAEERWNEFRIEVHAQKSALYNIGARQLSEKARRLELAAASDNLFFIRENLDGFLCMMGELRTQLEQIFPQADTALRPEATARQRVDLPANAAKMIELLDALEHDLTLELIDQVSAASYGEQVDETLARIKTLVNNFSYDSAADLMKKLVDL